MYAFTAFLFRFDVIHPPKYGRIERLRSNGRWVTTKRFFSRQLEKGKLRYNQVKSNPSSDYFRFVASVPGSDIVSGRNDSNDPNTSSEKEHTFHIKIISNTIRERRANVLRLINIGETVITDTHLMYQTFPHESPDSAFRYTIVSPPKYGVLLLSTSGQDLPSNSPSGSSSNTLGIDRRPKELSIDSEFSQLDLLAGHLKYRLSKRYMKAIDDSFTFRVATQDQTSSVQAFRIHHVPGDTDVDITLERLEVEEGAKRIISKKYLFIRASNIRHFVFNVTRSPIHGNIDILSRNKIDIDRANTTFFTLNEIEEERVLYKHDDSESRRDTFHFIATAASTNSANRFRNRRINGFQYVAVFHIAVVLRNDQTPTRVVDKVFEVVEGGQKLLTNQDLLFVDLDIDTKPDDIRYNHHAIPNGELVMVDNPSQPVFQFTQADLNNKKILFRHIGANFGRIMLWVSDGQYFVSTDLRVRASSPFVKIVNNSGLIIQHGDSAFLSAANLSVVTNLNAFGEDVKFRITSSPKYGEILKDDVPIKSFTEADLRSECIEYRHNGSYVKSSKDTVQFSVVALETSYANSGVSSQDGGLSNRHKAKTEGVLILHIYPEIYWEPLVVVSNNSLLVDEATSIALTEYDLQVATPSEMSSRDIIYMVRQPPLYGYLEIDPPLNIDELPSEDDNHLILSNSQQTKLTTSNQFVSSVDGGVSLFDQSVINEGRLHYIQAISNQTSDHFTFDITNGISELRDLVFHFTILPKTLYVETRELIATEGGEATLTTHNLHVITDYYVDKIEDYLIVDPPTSGILVATSNSLTDGKKTVSSSFDMQVTENAVAIFSVDDLIERRIRVS